MKKLIYIILLLTLNVSCSETKDIYIAGGLDYDNYFSEIDPDFNYLEDLVDIEWNEDDSNKIDDREIYRIFL